MTRTTRHLWQEHVLILAPVGEDIAPISETLAKAGIAATHCADLPDLCRRISQGEGPVILASKTLLTGHLPALLKKREAATAARTPLIVLADPRATGENEDRLLTELSERADVTLLEHPVRPREIVSVVRSALRAWARQRELADQVREHQQLQVQLRQSEEKLRALAEKAHVSFGIVQDTRFVYANPYFAESSGYSVEELLTMDFPQLVHPSFRPMMLERAARRQQGEPVPDHYEFMMLTKGGESRWVDFSVGTTEYMGKPAIIGTGFDITERKRAEEALRRSEESLRLALDAAQMGTWDWNIATGELIWSERSKALFGLPPDAEVTYERYLQLLHPEDRDSVLQAVRDALEHRTDLDVELRVQWADGTIHWVAGKGRGFYDAQGRPVRMAGMALDITHRKRADEELRHSEEQRRLAMKAAEMGSWELDLSCQMWTLDERCREIWAAPEWTKVSMDDLVARIHPEDRQAVGDRITQACDPQGSGMAELEFRIIWPDGQIRWLCASGHAIFKEENRQRRAVRGVGVTLDITRQKQVELALREAEERFRAFMDNTPTIAWAKDPQGRYVYVNRTYEQRLGKRLEDCRGKTDYEIWPAEIAEAFQRNDRETLTADRAVDMMEENIDLHGDSCYWWVLKFPFQDAAGNRYIGGIGVDVTDRKRAEQTLRESEEKFRTLTENAQAMIGIVQGRRFVYANPYLSQISGYSREEILQMDISQLLHADFREIVLDRAARRQSGEPVPHHYEIVMVTRDGQQRWLDMCPDTIVYNGQPAIIGIAYDITDRRRAEQQLRELMEHLEHLVAQRTAVAERRTQQLRALTMELAQAEQRERRRLAQVLHDHLQQLLVSMKFTASTIRRNGPEDLPRQLHKLDTLVEDALKASRDLVVDLSPPILHKDTMVQVLSWLAEWVHDKHGLHVTIDADDRANPQSEEVRTLLFQTVRELLLNTVKHAGVKTASVQLRSLGEELVEVIVRDEGVGFDPQASRQQSSGGFGLLSLHERLEALGGHMEIQSSPGKGTQTTVRVPAGPLQTNQPAPASAHQAELQEDSRQAAREVTCCSRGIRVLLADDHPMVRDGLAELLERNAGIEVVGEVSDGSAAVELARRVRPDVVLMDVDMPGLDGIEATRRIVTEQPDVRVIGLSMYTEPAKDKAMRSAGAVGYVPKSASADALIAAVRQFAGA